jgi:hypothetical protein
MPEPEKLLVACESALAERVLWSIARDLGRENSFVIHTMQGSLSPPLIYAEAPIAGKPKLDIANELKKQARRNAYAKVIVVFDLEFGSPLQHAPERSTYADFWLAPAVPNIEAWVLSDPQLFELYISSGDSSLPPSFDEYISDARFHFMNQKEKNRLTTHKMLGNYSASRAAMFSPSLRSFIRMGEMDNDDLPRQLDVELPRELLSNLVLEYYPPQKPLYKSLDGSVLTGCAMAEEIARGSEIGRKYASDLLRVCRDLLARQAQNSGA